MIVWFNLLGEYLEGHTKPALLMYTHTYMYVHTYVHANVHNSCIPCVCTYVAIIGEWSIVSLYPLDPTLKGYTYVLQYVGPSLSDYACSL